MKMHSFAQCAWTLAGTAIVALSASSCKEDTPPLQKPEINIEILEVGDHSVEFAITAEHSEYFTWKISSGESESREMKVEDNRFETVRSDLNENTEYTITATAWNGNLSAEATETFTTSVTPAIEIGAISSTHNSVTFTLKPTGSEEVYWAIKETGDAVSETDWKKVEEVSDEITLSADGLAAETSYTISAYGATGEITGEIAEKEFTTAREPAENEYITVSAGAAAHGVCIEVTCGSMDGRKYYSHVFSPTAEFYDYDTGKYYTVNSKENFLTYVKSYSNYLSWVDLYGDESRFSWLEYDADGNEITPDSDFLVYAVTFTEEPSGTKTFDEDGIIEIKVHTPAADVIGEGAATMDFTVEPGGDAADIIFSDYGEVACYTSGHVTAADAEEDGGIENYVRKKFEGDRLYFNSMTYFSETTRIRSLTPGSDYWYYTLCYGKDGKLGAVHAKKFTTGGLEFSDQYTCTINILKMSGTEASFEMVSDNCTRGRWCHVTAEEFESSYGGDLEKLVSAKLASDRAEQVFTDSKAYMYGLVSGTDYVLAVLPMGGDMGTIYGTPEMAEFTFSPEQ